MMAWRAKRALQSTQCGELSWQRETSNNVVGSVSPPPVPRAPVARELIEYNPEDQVVLDGELLLQNLRKSRRAGPSGLTGEHLRVILDSEADSVAFCEFARVLSIGEVPPEVMKAIRLGRMTALSKPDGGSAWHCGRRFSASSGRPHTGPAVLPGSVEGNFFVPISPYPQGQEPRP